MAIDQRVEHFAERRVVARAEPNGFVGGDRIELDPLVLKSLFDTFDDVLALFLAPMDREPARTLGHPHAHEKDDEAQDRAGQERKPPSPFCRDERRIEEHNRDHRAERRADPETAVDREVELAAVARGNQFLDGRIDGRIFAADAAAGEEAKHEEGEAVPGEAGQRRRNKVDNDGDEEEHFASESIGQPAEKQRANNGAEKVGAARQSNLGIGEMKRRALFQGRRDRAGERDLESVENPRNAQRDDDQNVKAAPWQAFEPRRNEGRDLFRLMRGCR